MSQDHLQSLSEEDDALLGDVLDRLRGYSPSITYSGSDEFIDPKTQITFEVTMSREWLDEL